MIKDKKSETKGKKTEGPVMPAVFVAKDVSEAIINPKGNPTVQDIVKALAEDGIQARVEPASTGYVLWAKGDSAYLENSFGEDENGLSVPGSLINVDGMRQPWLRKALCKVFGLKSEDELFDAILNKEFMPSPTGFRLYIHMLPLKIFDDETLGKLDKARKAIGMDINFSIYFDSAFSEALPQYFTVLSQTNPNLYPKTVKALRSMLGQDQDFLKAVEAAKSAAKKIIDEVEKDPEGMKEKLSEMAKKAWLDGLKK